MATTKPHFEDTATDIREYLWSLKHELEADLKRGRLVVTMAGEALHRVQVELNQLPYNEQIAELSLTELASLCETHGVFVPDRLLMDETEAA